MAVNLLPQHTGNVTNSEAGDAGEDACGDDDPEKIPEPFDERAARQLVRQETPGKRRSTNESREESNVCSQVFYRRAPKVVELGKDSLLRLAFVSMNLLRGRTVDITNI